MLADLEAESGAEAALPLIEQLRAYQPGEADVVLATLRFRQGRFDEAATALEAAFDDFRRNPWALTRFKERGVVLAAAVAVRSDLLGARMFEALGQPFAIRAVEDERLLTRATLTARLNFKGLCGHAMDAFEPHVPWTDSFLKLRRDCYQAIGDQRLAGATSDLADFVARQPIGPGGGASP